MKALAKRRLKAKLKELHKDEAILYFNLLLNGWTETREVFKPCTDKEIDKIMINLKRKISYFLRNGAIDGVDTILVEFEHKNRHLRVYIYPLKDNHVFVAITDGSADTRVSAKLRGFATLLREYFVG